MIDPNRKFHNRADRDATWLILLDVAIAITIALPLAFTFGESNTIMYIFFGVVIGVFLLLGGLTLYFIAPKRKMRRGLIRTTDGINYLKDNYEGKLYHDIKISDKLSIDNLLITPYGVFLIQVRTYLGYLSGIDSEKEWRQSIAFKKQKSPIPNPVKECLYIKDYLKDNLGVDIIPMVILASGNRGYINSKYVYAPNELMNVLNPNDKKVLSEGEIKSLIKSLDNL